MNQETLLYTLPQWLIFAAITASIYGWAEHKKVFRMIGPMIIIFLGVYAFYIIYSGYFDTFNYLIPDEVMNGELNENALVEIPFQAKLLPAYVSFIFSALFAIPALILQWREKKLKNLFMIIANLIALAGFFIIVGELQALK